MNEQQNLGTFRKVIEEGFNQGNYPALDPLFVPGYVEHQDGLHKNLEGFKDDIRGLRASFPDFTLTIEDVVADGDRLWVRSTARGTNLGPFFGPPTGKPMRVTVIDICRFKDGKICEHWGVPDRFTVLAQLGLLPVPQPQGR
ncbi:MAG TPA: ester cyclase [Anaerolineaceae bacterium]|nr:ester cyclase [Anaerolineaceae bacterium]